MVAVKRAEARRTVGEHHVVVACRDCLDSVIRCCESVVGRGGAEFGGFPRAVGDVGDVETRLAQSGGWWCEDIVTINSRGRRGGRLRSQGSDGEDEDITCS